MIADQWEIPRSELDELAVRSHQLAHQATEEGRFEREIVPFQVNGDTYVTDQGIRPDTTLEKLAELKPAFKEDGKITAGNSSQISDGAAAVLLMTPREGRRAGPQAAREDRRPDHGRRRPGDHAHRPDPGDAEDPRAQRDEDRRHRPDRDQRGVRAGGRRLARELEPDMDRVNVNGGAIALGHPLGSTGARLITTLLHELERSDKETGLVTMCCGGGPGHRHADPARLIAKKSSEPASSVPWAPASIGARSFFALQPIAACSAATGRPVPRAADLVLGSRPGGRPRRHGRSHEHARRRPARRGRGREAHAEGMDRAGARPWQQQAARRRAAPAQASPSRR